MSELSPECADQRSDDAQFSLKACVSRNRGSRPRAALTPTRTGLRRMNADLPEVARVLPDYDVGDEIGRGEFGVVWGVRCGDDVVVRLVGRHEMSGVGRFDSAHFLSWPWEVRVRESSHQVP
jgi:hypothetical protein